MTAREIIFVPPTLPDTNVVIGGIRFLQPVILSGCFGTTNVLPNGSQPDRMGTTAIIIPDQGYVKKMIACPTSIE